MFDDLLEPTLAPTLAPRQWLVWGGARGDMHEYGCAAAVTVSIACLLHTVFLRTHSKPILEAKHYKASDVGDSALHPRIEDATCFTYLVISCFFVCNWCLIHAGILPSPFTLGVQCGACAGYEVYSAFIEIHLLLSGTRRADMLVHHALCFAFVGLAVVAYSATKAPNLVFWHLAWDSISRMLVSNVPLNLRHFFRENLVVNGVFALTFLSVRGLEQMPLVLDMYEIATSRAAAAALGSAPPIDAATGAVVACWAMLQLLNLVWIGRLLKHVVRLVRGGDNNKAA